MTTIAIHPPSTMPYSSNVGTWAFMEKTDIEGTFSISLFETYWTW